MTSFDVTCILVLAMFVLLILSHLVADAVTNRKLRRQHRSLAGDIVDVMKQADRNERKLDGLDERINGRMHGSLGLRYFVDILRDDYKYLRDRTDEALGRRIDTVGGHVRDLKLMSTEWLKLLLVTEGETYIHAAAIKEELKQREVEAMWLDKKTDDEDIREEVYGD